MSRPEICRPLGWLCGHSQKSLVIVSLMSNNYHISKIHFVVVFVDMAEDLGAMVKHRNSSICVPQSEF